MFRNVVSVILGYGIWTAIFLGGAAAVRSTRAEFHNADGFTSDSVSLIAYLVISMIASLAAGYIGAKTASSTKMVCTWILALCLLATGVPVQLSAWNELPVWYNLAFLILLVPVTISGAVLAFRSPRK